MFEYWIVKDNKTGRVIAHCGDLNDAMMLVSFDPSNRSYSRNRVLLDQIIDVTSTTDKQLSGQIGLPDSSQKNLGEFVNKLPEGTAIPVIF